MFGAKKNFVRQKRAAVGKILKKTSSFISAAGEIFFNFRVIYQNKIVVKFSEKLQILDRI